MKSNSHRASRVMARSMPTDRPIPGYRTFTARSRPSQARARCTWPRLAAAIGEESKDSKRSCRGAPSSLSTRARTSANGCGSTRSCRRASSSVTSGGTTSTRRLATWPSLIRPPRWRLAAATKRRAKRPQRRARSGSGSARIPRRARTLRAYRRIAWAISESSARLRRTSARKEGPRGPATTAPC